MTSFFLSFFLGGGQRQRPHEQGRGRERGRQDETRKQSLMWGLNSRNRGIVT